MGLKETKMNDRNVLRPGPKRSKTGFVGAAVLVAGLMLPACAHQKNIPTYPLGDKTPMCGAKVIESAEAKKLTKTLVEGIEGNAELVRRGVGAGPANHVAVKAVIKVNGAGEATLEEASANCYGPGCPGHTYDVEKHLMLNIDGMQVPLPEKECGWKLNITVPSD